MSLIDISHWYIDSMLIGGDTDTDQPVSKSDLERMLFVFNVKRISWYLLYGFYFLKLAFVSIILTDSCQHDDDCLSLNDTCIEYVCRHKTNDYDVGEESSSERKTCIK